MTNLLDESQMFKRLPFDPHERRLLALNGNDLLVKKLRACESQLIYLSEMEAEACTTAKFIEHFKTFCQREVNPSLLDATYDQLTGEKENTSKVIDFIDLQDGDQESATMIQVAIPYYASKKQELKTLVKKLIDQNAKLGYFFSSDGYAAYPAHVGLPESVEVEYVTFESMYSKLDVDLSSNLFHVTSVARLKSIAKNGLVPKSESKDFDYPPRIYLFNKSDFELIQAYGEDKALKSGSNCYAVVKILKTKLESYEKYKSGELKLYRDPAFSDDSRKTGETAIFTYDPIPRSLLEDHVAMYVIGLKETKIMNLE